MASLRDPLAYGPTQQLGAWMRDQGIGAFEYLSARSMDALVQVGVFSPEVFQSTRFDQVEISTEISADHTTFLFGHRHLSHPDDHPDDQL